ncbi:MAG: hypothetical protein OXJ55_17195 [Caldilineaceae bacterium]|nr:hypothetical protein [Caldilineaceae bacterium]
MTVVQVDRAWEIAREFAGLAKLADTDNSIIGIYVIGSLGADEYVPGRSDIDTALVTRDSVTPVLRDRLREIRRGLVVKYVIPKGFGGIVFPESDLFPPYDHERELVPEIYRLLVQGKRIWGNYDLTRIPTPTRSDFRAWAGVFHAWLRSDRPDKEHSVVAAVNRTLIEIRLLLWDKTDRFILNKRELIPAFLLTTYSEGFRDELTDIQGYVLGHQDRHDLEYLEGLMERITGLVAREVKL